MNSILFDFQNKIDYYECVCRQIDRLHYDMEDADDEIKWIKEHIKCLYAEIERYEQLKLRIPEEIKVYEAKADEIVATGTIIKVDDWDDDDDVCDKPRRQRRHRKAQLPCSNHTYKDLRYIKGNAERKTLKHYAQSEIKNNLATSFRLGYDAIPEFDGDGELI